MDTSLFHSDFIANNRIIYTASSFAKTSLIYLQEVGFLQAKSQHVSKRDHLVSYLFFIVTSGTGYLDYEGTTYSLKAGDCVFIDCRKPYAHRTSENLWQLRWVHFYGPNMNHIYEKYAERGGRPYFHPDNLDEYNYLLQELYELAASDDYVRDMMIYEKIISLLTLLMKESWHPEHSRKTVTGSKKQMLQDIKDYLDSNYQKKVSLDELSHMFFINKFYLTRVFKEQFGLSINNYLLQIRITHAKQLLRFTDMTLEAIGSECGMGDPNYFSRMFKKVEGISPREFRTMW